MHYSDVTAGFYRDTQSGEVIAFVGKDSYSGFVLYMVTVFDEEAIYTSLSGEFPTLERVEFREGQIWSPCREGEHIEVEYSIGAVVQYIGCASNRREQAYIQDFFKSYELPEWSEEPGVHCDECGKFFEYANRVKGFNCWACRNGY